MDTRWCAGLDLRRQVGEHRVEGVAQAAPGALERLLPRVEPRQPQQVLHEPLHARGVAADDLEEAARLGAEPGSSSSAST